MKQQYKLLSFVALILAAASCAKKSDNASGVIAPVVSLSSLPNLSSMVNSNEGSAASLQMKSILSYSGTPPTLAEVGETSAGNITAAAQTKIKDNFFTQALLTSINATDPSGGNYVPVADREKFFGSVAGGPGGMGSCQMAQAVGESIGRIMSVANSTCYMKGITRLSSGFSVISGHASQASLFDQEASDKTLKVAVTAQQNMEVFIKVYGSNNVGSDIYKVRLHFCDAGNVTSYETYTINKSSGLYTVVGGANVAGNVNSFDLSAYLNLANLSEFDASQPRIANMQYHQPNNDYKGRVEISGSNVKGYRWWSDGVSSWKMYATALFSGAALSSLRFYEGGFQGQSVWVGGNNTFSGAAEFNTSHYVALAASSYLTDAQAAGPGGSSEHNFFAGNIVAPTVDLSGYSCNEAITAAVTLDLTSAAGAALDSACQGERFDGYQMCQINEVRNAEDKVYQSWGH